MTFIKDCVELFGTKDLYQVLNLEKNKSLSAAKIKKSYYQQSILWHPDRYAAEQHDEASRELAKRKFQVINRVYLVLSDKQKRELYDETGTVDGDDNVLATERDWTAVWRGMFNKVTQEDIDAYLAKFRGSEQEMSDVKKAYTKYKGDMDKILATVIGADVHNEDRIREIIRYAIESGEVKSFAKFVKEPPSARLKRMKAAQREAKEAGKMLKEMQKDVEGEFGNDKGDLASLILAKKKKRAEEQNDFLAHLAEKYGGGEEGPKKKARKNK